METLTITSTTERTFIVRIVRGGDRWGLNGALTHDGDDPLVFFHDTKMRGSARLAAVDAYTAQWGQVASQYYASTLLKSTPGVGLNLDGSSAAWTIDAAAMDVVRAWLALQIPRGGDQDAALL